MKFKTFFRVCCMMGEKVDQRTAMTSLSPTGHPILTVSQLSHAIKLCLEKAFPLVWLQGEISNLKPHSSGHLYFSLKDANAQISAVMFRPDAASMAAPLKDGMQVIVRGEINVYPLSGKYQIVIRELRPVGIGELLLKLEELKIKLHKMGWFRSDRKRPLPKFPKVIGVVTSPTGAAIQDMLNILTRRFKGFHLILNPVRVQGEGAAQEIAQAIKQFNEHKLVDVMIVGRGGGSIEDLWAFNEEIVAEAIINSAIPVISAVGHETDHCIADYVADLRAPTPSAAAEIVVAEASQQLTHLQQMQKRMQQTVKQLIRQDRHRLAGMLRHPVLSSPYGVLGPWIQKLDGLRQETDDTVRQHVALQRVHLGAKKQRLLSLNPLVRLNVFKQRIAALEKSIDGSMRRRLDGSIANLQRTFFTLAKSVRYLIARTRAAFQPEAKLKQLDTLLLRDVGHSKEFLKRLKESLDAVNPKNLLTKGYCILFSEKDSSTITSIHSVEKAQKIRILLSDGNIKATINEVESL